MAYRKIQEREKEKYFNTKMVPGCMSVMTDNYIPTLLQNKINDLLKIMK